MLPQEYKEMTFGNAGKFYRPIYDRGPYPESDQALKDHLQDVNAKIRGLASSVSRSPPRRAVLVSSSDEAATSVTTHTTTHRPDKKIRWDLNHNPVLSDPVSAPIHQRRTESCVILQFPPFDYRQRSLTDTMVKFYHDLDPSNSSSAPKTPERDWLPHNTNELLSRHSDEEHSLRRNGRGKGNEVPNTVAKIKAMRANSSDTTLIPPHFEDINPFDPTPRTALAFGNYYRATPFPEQESKFQGHDTDSQDVSVIESTNHWIRNVGVNTPTRGLKVTAVCNTAFMQSDNQEQNYDHYGLKNSNMQANILQLEHWLPQPGTPHNYSEAGPSKSRVLKPGFGAAIMPVYAQEHKNYDPFYQPKHISGSSGALKQFPDSGTFSTPKLHSSKASDKAGGTALFPAITDLSPSNLNPSAPAFQPRSQQPVFVNNHKHRIGHGQSGVMQSFSNAQTFVVAPRYNLQPPAPYDAGSAQYGYAPGLRAYRAQQDTQPCNQQCQQPFRQPFNRGRPYPRQRRGQFIYNNQAQRFLTMPSIPQPVPALLHTQFNGNRSHLNPNVNCRVNPGLFTVIGLGRPVSTAVVNAMSVAVHKYESRGLPMPTEDRINFRGFLPSTIRPHHIPDETMADADKAPRVSRERERALRFRPARILEAKLESGKQYGYWHGGFVELNDWLFANAICPADLVQFPCRWDELEGGCQMLRLCSTFEKYHKDSQRCVEGTAAVSNAPNKCSRLHNIRPSCRFVVSGVSCGLVKNKGRSCPCGHDFPYGRTLAFHRFQAHLRDALEAGARGCVDIHCCVYPSAQNDPMPW